MLVDTVLAVLNKTWWTRRKEYGFRLDAWYFPSVAYADDIVVLATSQKALEQMILHLTEGLREMGLEMGHAKKELNAQVTGTMATSRGRKSGIGRKADLRRDLHVAERKLSTVGTTRRETSTGNVQTMTNTVLSVSDSQPKGGSTGRISLAKHDVESTGMAPKKIARLRKAEETTPAGRWKERHRKGHMIMGRKRTQTKERQKLLHRWARHMARAATDREASKAPEQGAYNGGETHKQNTNQNGTEYIPKDSRARGGKHRLQNVKEHRDGKSSNTKTVQAGYNKHRTEKNEKKTKTIRKDNSGSSSSLKKQLKTKNCSKIPGNTRSFLVGKKSFW